MIISKYICKIIISAVLIMVLVLVGIELLFEFTHEFPDVGTGFYGWRQVLQFVPMMLPQDIYQLAPMVGLLGSLIGLSLLAGHSELLIMRASGLSQLNIFWIAFKAALFLALVMVLIGEVLAPISQRHAMEKKSLALSGGQAMLTAHGIWLKNKNNFIHIGAIQPDGHLKSVLRYQFSAQNHLALASFAEEGSYEQGRWIFKNITATKLGSDKAVSEKVAEQDWNLSLSPRLLGLANTNPEQKSLPALYQYIKDRAKSGLNTERYEFIFWQRVFHPLAILVMVMLSVPFVFGFFKSKALGLRIFVGAVVGFSFYTVTLFIGRFALVFHLPVIISSISPIILFALLLNILLIKQKISL